MSGRLDFASLAAGIAIVLLGALLLLDQGGEVALSLGLVGALLAAVIGIVLLISGLTDPEPSRPPGPEPSRPADSEPSRRPPRTSPAGADER